MKTKRFHGRAMSLQETEVIVGHNRARISQVLKVAPLLVMALWIGACGTGLRDTLVSPALSGVVHRGGKPVENVLVSLEVPREDGCFFTGGVLTRTDQDGRFQFAVRQDTPFQLFPSIGSSNHFQVCIAEGAIKYQGWYERKLRGAEETLSLDCNLQSPLPIYQYTSGGKVMGICRAGSMPR